MQARARQHMLLVEEVENELVVYDQERHSAHRLNPTTAMVWRNLDGTRSVEEVTQALKDNLNPIADEDLVWAAVSELEKANLLDGPIGRSVEENRISRRRAVRRLGLVGTLSLLLPAISSVLVAEAEEAASPPLGSGSGSS